MRCRPVFHPADKADMDVEAFNDGILGSIVVPEGGVAQVGTPIAFIAETEADLEAAKAKGGGEAAAGDTTLWCPGSHRWFGLVLDGSAASDAGCLLKAQ